MSEQELEKFRRSERLRINHIRRKARNRLKEPPATQPPATQPSLPEPFPPMENLVNCLYGLCASLTALRSLEELRPVISRYCEQGYRLLHPPPPLEAGKNGGG